MSVNDDFDPLAFSIQITCLVIIFVIAVSGNGLVCCVVYRHKRLRTIPNFFIVNLSVIDLCNSLINMPLFAGYHVIETQIFQDKFVFIVCSSLYRFTQFLSLQTLLVITLGRQKPRHTTPLPLFGSLELCSRWLELSEQIKLSRYTKG